MKRCSKTLLLASFLVFAAACDRPAPFGVERVPLPAAAASLAPQLFSVGGRLSLSWLEKDADRDVLRYVTWTGNGWSTPHTVMGGTDWFTNPADMPGVRPLPGGGWLAWWLQKSGDGTYAYDVRMATSDDGVTWQAAGSPHHDGTQTEHGFVSVFDTSAGLGMVWLDGRNTASTGGHHGHGDGGMTLRYAAFDTTGTQTADLEIDSLVCDCCQTDAAAIEGGAVVVYRDRTEDEIRDIHAARFVDGHWQAPVRVHADGWRIDGCPVNGPAVAAQGENVAVAWFTAVDGKAEVRVALSADGGRHFAPPARMDAGGALGHVDVVLHPESGAVVSWMASREGDAILRVRAVDSSHQGVEIGGVNSRAFPRMAVLDDGRLLLAWTEAGSPGGVRTGVVDVRGVSGNIR